MMFLQPELVDRRAQLSPDQLGYFGGMHVRTPSPSKRPSMDCPPPPPHLTGRLGLSILHGQSDFVWRFSMGAQGG